MSTKSLTQSQAVVDATKTVLAEAYQLGTQVILTDDQQKEVSDILVAGFLDRSIPLKPTAANEARLSDLKALQAYVKSLIKNWLGKSTALNGKAAPVEAAEAKEEVPVKPTKEPARSPKRIRVAPTQQQETVI